MSARNMVHNMRESGALNTRPPAGGTRRGLVLVAMAVAIGAVLVVAATFLPGQLSHLVKATQPPPVKVDYVKPGG